MENCMEFPQKIKNRTMIQSRNFTPEYIFKETNKLMNIYTSMFIGALFIIAKMWKLPKYP